MKVQRLIEKYEKLEGVWNAEGAESARKIFLMDLKQLDEPQPVKVPQFVADWIEYCKRTGVNLYNALEMGDLYFYNYANQKDDLKLKEFFETDTNQDLFARAWLDGYEVEEEKRYVVNLKNGQPLVKAPLGGNLYFNQNITAGNYKATQKQLEEAGFGWVFDCLGIEIKEVKG
jgi:hypothetical protein